MLESWAIASACCTSGAVWLWYWSPTRVLPGEEVAHELPMPLVLEMLAVAIRRGASIPHALIVVGRIVGGDFGEGLSSVRRGRQAMTSRWCVTSSPLHGQAGPRR